MIRAVLLCSGLIGALPEGRADDLKAYEAAKAQVGRDPKAHVKLALWCEAHGLDAERLRHLAQAVLIDPKDATARGLLGLVAYRGRWERPEAVGASVRADEAMAARLAEYNERREKLEKEVEALKHEARHNARYRRFEAARDHDALGVWCASNGLKAEATAHFTTAVVLHPYFDDAWRHLGYQKYHERWMSPEQIADAKREDQEKKRAEEHWTPLLTRWRAWLDGSRGDEARARLAAVNDPRAVSSIARILLDGVESHQAAAVEVLGRLDTTESTEDLAQLAVFNRHPSIREAATAPLKGREARDYAGKLVDLIHTPMTYKVEQPVGGPGTQGALLVESPRFRVLRTYQAPMPFQISGSFYGYVGLDPNGLPVMVRGAELSRMARENSGKRASDLKSYEARTQELIAESQIKAVIAQQRLIADVNDIEQANAWAVELNSRVGQVLHATLDAPDMKDDEDAWKTWWNDRLGYRYEPPPQVQAAVNATPQLYAPHVYSCFAPGTLVRTLEGRRPIEALKVGDQVLSQDATDGALSFQPILVVHHNAPGRTLRIALDDGMTLAASVYHRFWRAGLGWAMARDLKPGDTLRTLGGLTRIVSVAEGEVEPLFNLDVAGGRTYFVGPHDALVHDNTLPDPRLRPFDAGPALASAGR